ncbi:hypothetical protein EIP91_002406 [Steccherinum ochraceum]|uniref:Uncharacterized protein n=1 Tax=Steccherinum ochraceum TaxID=92696 RepID=A0A4R0RPB0_9APHY|nr:hypothetical protein EIP91_002406 [Steccherinum ochraceum]
MGVFTSKPSRPAAGMFTMTVPMNASDGPVVVYLPRFLEEGQRSVPYHEPEHADWHREQSEPVAGDDVGSGSEVARLSDSEDINDAMHPPSRSPSAFPESNASLANPPSISTSRRTRSPSISESTSVAAPSNAANPVVNNPAYITRPRQTAFLKLPNVQHATVSYFDVYELKLQTPTRPPSEGELPGLKAYDVVDDVNAVP